MKRILIISESKDLSTNNVIDWFSCKEVEIFRINQEDSVKILNLSLIDNSVNFKLKKNHKQSIQYNEIEAYWYR